MADHYSIASQQIGVKIETVSGTAETIAAADIELRPFREMSYTPDYNRFANDEVSDDIAHAADFVAGKKGTIDAGFIFKGSGTLGTAPAIGKYLRACGLKQETVKLVALDAAPAGGDAKFLEGEAFTTDNSAAGTIEADTAIDSVRLIVTTGTVADDDVITCESDTATVSGTPTNYGIRYAPRSSGHETVTIQRAIKNHSGTAEKDSLVTIKGALGTGTIEAEALNSMRFNGSFMGCESSQGNGTYITGATLEDADPSVVAKLLNATLTAGGTALIPSSFTLDFGNNIELDPDPTTGGGSNGYDFARILSREPQITIDPRRVPSDVFDDLGKLGSGDTFAFSFTSSGSAGHIIEIAAPKCQLREYSEGNRADLQTSDLTFVITRHTVSDADYKIYFR